MQAKLSHEEALLTTKVCSMSAADARVLMAMRMKTTAVTAAAIGERFQLSIECISVWFAVKCTEYMYWKVLARSKS